MMVAWQSVMQVNTIIVIILCTTAYDILGTADQLGIIGKYQLISSDVLSDGTIPADGVTHNPPIPAATVSRWLQGMLVTGPASPNNTISRAAYTVCRTLVSSTFNGATDCVNDGYLLYSFDAVLLYAYALRKLYDLGHVVTSASIITQMMGNITFNGATGSVSLNTQGDRFGNYFILNWINGSNVHIGTYNGVTKQIVFTQSQLYYDSTFVPPLDSLGPPSTLSIQFVLALLVGCILVLLLLAFLIRMRLKNRRLKEEMKKKKDDTPVAKANVVFEYRRKLKIEFATQFVLFILEVSDYIWKWVNIVGVLYTLTTLTTVKAGYVFAICCSSIVQAFAFHMRIRNCRVIHAELKTGLVMVDGSSNRTLNSEDPYCEQTFLKRQLSTIRIVFFTLIFHILPFFVLDLVYFFQELNDGAKATSDTIIFDVLSILGTCLLMGDKVSRISRYPELSARLEKLHYYIAITALEGRRRTSLKSTAPELMSLGQGIAYSASSPTHKMVANARSNSQLDLLERKFNSSWYSLNSLANNFTGGTAQADAATADTVKSYEFSNIVFVNFAPNMPMEMDDEIPITINGVTSSNNSTSVSSSPGNSQNSSV